MIRGFKYYVFQQYLSYIMMVSYTDRRNWRRGLGFWCLTQLSTIFQLYRGSQFLLVEETRVPGENHIPATSH